MNVKKIISLIVLDIVLAVSLFILLSTVLPEFLKLDSPIRNFIPMLGLSGIAIFLFILRNRKDTNRYLMDSLELLLLLIVPILSAIPFLVSNKETIVLIPAILTITVVGWFVILFLRNPQQSENEDKEKLSNANKIVALLFGFLIAQFITMFWFIMQILPWMH